FVGALMSLPLVGGVVYSSYLVDACNPIMATHAHRKSLASYELGTSVIETIVCLFYILLTWLMERAVKRQMMHNESYGKKTKRGNTWLAAGTSNLAFYILIPYTVYMLCGVASHIVLIVQFANVRLLIPMRSLEKGLDIHFSVSHRAFALKRTPSP